MDDRFSKDCKNPRGPDGEILREIDRIVYDLYGLTEEEIAIVKRDSGAQSIVYGNYTLGE